jgi:hypothetical protein
MTHAIDGKGCAVVGCMLVIQATHISRMTCSLSGAGMTANQ